MAIEATYVLNDFIKSLTTALGPFDFYPGNQAKDSDRKFVLYSVTQGTDPEMYFVNMDTIRYRIVHPSFDNVSRFVSLVLRNLNVEDIEVVNIARLNAQDSTIRFQHANVISGRILDAFYADGTKYFYCDLNASITYTQLPQANTHHTDALITL
jgi:hypothetical protein